MARVPPSSDAASLSDLEEGSHFLGWNFSTCEQRAWQSHMAAGPRVSHAKGGGGQLGSQCPSQGAAWPWQTAAAWGSPRSHNKPAIGVFVRTSHLLNVCSITQTSDVPWAKQSTFLGRSWLLGHQSAPAWAWWPLRSYPRSRSGTRSTACWNLPPCPQGAPGISALLLLTTQDFILWRPQILILSSMAWAKHNISPHKQTLTQIDSAFTGHKVGQALQACISLPFPITRNSPSHTQNAPPSPWDQEGKEAELEGSVQQTRTQILASPSLAWWL